MKRSNGVFLIKRRHVLSCSEWKATGIPNPWPSNTVQFIFVQSWKWRHVQSRFTSKLDDDNMILLVILLCKVRHHQLWTKMRDGRTYTSFIPLGIPTLLPKVFISKVDSNFVVFYYAFTVPAIMKTLRQAMPIYNTKTVKLVPTVPSISIQTVYWS